RPCMAQCERAGVERKPFEACDGSAGSGDGANVSFGEIDDVRALDEVVDAEGRGESRRASCRQDVIGTGNVVACRHWTEGADEDRATILKCFQVTTCVDPVQ